MCIRDSSHVFRRPQVAQRHTQKFLARITIVRHCGIVDLEDAQRFRILDPHRMRMGREEKTVVLHGSACGEELLLQQGQNPVSYTHLLRSTRQTACAAF